jgi:AcrR family transcriptional regulator
METSKRDKLTEFNRGNILSAAKALFETSGIQQTTMDDIARKADCSKSTIYIYFKSKDEIYNSILLESMVMLRERFRAAAAENAGFEESYFSICRALTEFQRDYPLYFNGILGEISVDEADFGKYPVLRDIYDVGEEINALVSVMLVRGMESGCLRPDLKPIPTIFTLWASLCGIIKMADQKEKYFRDKLLMSRKEYLDYSFRMLLRTLKAGE